MAALRILIADDDQEFRHVLRTALEGEGHSIVEAANGREATKLLLAADFDIIILDLIMPDGDGFEVMGEIRKRNGRARIIVASGGGEHLVGETYLQMAERLGAHAVLNKPFTTDVLRAAISRVTGTP